MGPRAGLFPVAKVANDSGKSIKVQGDSKLLSGFPWPIIFKPEITK
jgi:hypothetical protein